MILKDVISEDFINYKKPSMVLLFPYCSFKCEKDCGVSGICQNSPLYKQRNLNIDIETIIDFYLKNDITKAIVMGGLEPFDSFDDLFEFVSFFRKQTNDDIVIYTGYNKEEITEQIKKLHPFGNIIVKFGRFMPDRIQRLDEVLGIRLVSDNQYAERI